MLDFKSTLIEPFPPITPEAKGNKLLPLCVSTSVVLNTTLYTSPSVSHLAIEYFFEESISSSPILITGDSLSKKYSVPVFDLKSPISVKLLSE